jgi:hypothetical protein
MINGERASLVICLTVVMVIFINLAIFSLLRRGPGSNINQVEMLRRAARRARQPWQEEDDNLKELSRQVAALKHPHEEEEEEDLQAKS